MDPLTIVAIATAALQGVAEALAIWPTIQEIVQGGQAPTADQQTQIDAAMDAAHAALQSA